MFNEIIRVAELPVANKVALPSTITKESFIIIKTNTNCKQTNRKIAEEQLLAML